MKKEEFLQGLREALAGEVPTETMRENLRYYEDYEVWEIAALLGRSPALVSTHLKRGKEKLRNMLGGTEYAREF